MRLVVSLLDSIGIERFYGCRKFCGIVVDLDVGMYYILFNVILVLLCCCTYFY